MFFPAPVRPLNQGLSNGPPKASLASPCHTSTQYMTCHHDEFLLVPSRVLRLGTDSFTGPTVGDAFQLITIENVIKAALHRPANRAPRLISS